MVIVLIADPTVEAVLHDILVGAKQMVKFKTTLKPLIEHPKSQNRSPMHFCFKTLGICLTESDSDQTETGWLRRTSKALTNLSPLRPLRGAILVAEVVVEIEDEPGTQ